MSRLQGVDRGAGSRLYGKPARLRLRLRQKELMYATYSTIDVGDMSAPSVLNRSVAILCTSLYPPPASIFVAVDSIVDR